jgi:guanine deaminase
MPLLPKRRRQKKFMSLAVSQGLKGLRKNHGGPFGAVVVQGGRVLARAHNRVIENRDPTAHAEILAIRTAAKRLKRFDLSDCALYATCEPCPMCLAAVYWAGIKKVYYGCTRRDAERIGFRDKLFYDLIKKRSPRSLEMVRTERRECLKLFEEWQQKKDRIMY